jgi:hypothetical protein
MSSQYSRALVHRTVEYCYGKKKHSKYELFSELQALKMRNPKVFDEFSLIVVNVIDDVGGKNSPRAENGKNKWLELNMGGFDSVDPFLRSLAL